MICAYSPGRVLHASGSPVVDPMYPALPDGCTPYSFPMLVRDGRRDAFRRELLREGTLAGAGWPESPFDPVLARSRLLSQPLELPPALEALTRQQLDRSLRCLERMVRHKP